MTTPSDGISRFARGSKTSNASSNALVPSDEPSETTERPDFDNMFGGRRMEEDTFGAGTTFDSGTFGGFDGGYSEDSCMFGGVSSEDSPKKSSQEEPTPLGLVPAAAMNRVSTNEGVSNVQLSKERVTNGASHPVSRSYKKPIVDQGGLSMAARPAERPKTPSLKPASKNATNAPARLSRFSQKRAPATTMGPSGSTMTQSGGVLSPPVPTQRTETTTAPEMANTNTGMPTFSVIQDTTAAVMKTTPTTTNKDNSEDTRVVPPKTPGQTYTASPPSTPKASVFSFPEDTPRATPSPEPSISSFPGNSHFDTPALAASIFSFPEDTPRAPPPPEPSISSFPAKTPRATPSPVSSPPSFPGNPPFDTPVLAANQDAQGSNDDSILVTPETATTTTSHHVPAQSFQEAMSNFLSDLKEGVDRFQGENYIGSLNDQIDAAIANDFSLAEQRNRRKGPYQVYNDAEAIKYQLSQLLEDVEQGRIDCDEAMQKLSLIG